MVVSLLLAKIYILASMFVWRFVDMDPGKARFYSREYYAFYTVHQ